MKNTLFCLLITATLYLLLNGCANIVPPSGGDKDVTPPELVEVQPGDSLLNTRVTEIKLKFDEFIVLNSPASEIQVSPVLPFPVTAEIEKRSVVVNIPDSLLKDNTTYRVSFGEAIKDLHEGNTFTGYNYIFSTGPYFDSLRISGLVTDAATGEPAQGGRILLYDADDSDSAIVRKKPMYVADIGGAGAFIINGLPKRAFHIYALKEENNNLIYDEDAEKVAFIDSIIIPADTLGTPIQLRWFQEELDDSLASIQNGRSGSGGKFSQRRATDDRKEFVYSVAVDTTDTIKRTYDITKPVTVSFNHPIDTLDLEKVFLTYDSLGAEIEAQFTINRDTSDNVLLLNSNWKENTLYTLRLYNGLATDTAGKLSPPSKHRFRTKSDNDYGILVVQLADEYYNSNYILQVTRENDTVYKKAVTDTVVTIRRLTPATYALRIIVDENNNGKWDTGDLFAKKQPEFVYSHHTTIELKSGWEAIIEFASNIKNAPGENVPDKWGGRKRK